jgi:5-methylcytosine-specific restriction protein A
MPQRAMRRCDSPGCEIVGSGRFCSQHATDRMRPEATYDRRRGSAHARGYNSRGRWGKLRKLVISRDPICKLNFKGCTHLSTLADHKLPKVAGGDDSMDNLQGTCASCHGIKTRTIDPGLIAAARAGGDRGSVLTGAMGSQTVAEPQTHRREFEKIVKLPQVQ